MRELFHKVRGIPVIDSEKCMACGACVSKCPTDSLSIHREKDSIVLELNLARCIRCAYCAEVCPAGAITVIDTYTVTASSPDKLIVRVVVPLAKCAICGSMLRFSAREVERAHSSLPDLKTVHLCEKCRIERLQIW